MILPEASDGFFSSLRVDASITVDVKVEQGEFVFGENIVVGLGLDAIPDALNGAHQEVGDGRVDFSLRIPDNLECRLN